MIKCHKPVDAIKRTAAVAGLLLLLLLFPNRLAAQPGSALNAKYTRQQTRILFLLDGSGSMVETWEGKSKFTLAKELLYKLTDSLEKTNPTVRFGVRVFGHQSPKAQKNCKDSQLELDFAAGNAGRLPAVLEKIQPQGWTPIAYSLFLALNDFPKDDNQQAQNAIILITDGMETCGGDPCAAGLLLQKKRIAVKPFIIGLGLEADKKDYFDCVGLYFDASNKQSFNRALGTVISHSLNNTTAQINLLDARGEPTETNIGVSLYDAYSGEVMYNFMHTLKENGTPDTLYLDPAGKYNMTVHTIPPVIKHGIELTPGDHNIIAVDAPQGTLDLTIEGNIKGISNLLCVVRKAGGDDILYVQDFNTTKKYLMGQYDLEILTLPRIHYPHYSITPGKANTIGIKQPGTLFLTVTRPGIGSIYRKSDDNELERIKEYKNISGKETVFLQPGDYSFIFRPQEDKKSALTTERKFSISSGLNTNLKL